MAAEFLNKAKKILQLATNDRILRIAASSTLAIHKERIYGKGESSEGGKIGTYSTNPISISKKQQAKQTGKTYFKGGYAEYKSAIGRNPGYVNLRNTDQMMGDYGLVNMGNGIAFGFQNDINGDKVDWMEEKYSKEIFSASEKERDIFSSVYSKEISKKL